MYDGGEHGVFGARAGRRRLGAMLVGWGNYMVTSGGDVSGGRNGWVRIARGSVGCGGAVV